MILSNLFWITTALCVAKVSSADIFSAAVVEPVTSEHVTPNVTKNSAAKIINKNLDHFEDLIMTAVDQKSQIIVFPEYGITGFGQSRKTAIFYAEAVPNPYGYTKVYPCNDLNTSSILHRLGCLADHYNIVIVANMIAVEECLPSDTDCPSDGHYIYNTDVAFQSDGQLVAYYHKINVYGDEKEIFDTGTYRLKNYGVFKTDFAVIGLFTCFDLLFESPAYNLVRGVGVDTIAFPTAWMNELPLLSAIEYQEAWAVRYNTTLLASNQHLPLIKMTGSGIYNGDRGALTYHYDMTTYMSKLLIATVPKRTYVKIDKGSREIIISKLINMDPNQLSEVSPVIRALMNADTPVDHPHHRDVHLKQWNVPEGHYQAETTFQGVMNDDLYTFQPLSGATGRVSVCNGSTCCHLNFTREEMSSYELYALGAFDGLHTKNGKYYLQTCALVRCQTNEGTKCGGEIETANGIFTDFSLRITGNYPQVFLFPEVVTNKVNLAIIGKEWISEYPYDHIRSIGNGVKVPLLAANIYGRFYELDGNTP